MFYSSVLSLRNPPYNNPHYTFRQHCYKPYSLCYVGYRWGCFTLHSSELQLPEGPGRQDSEAPDYLHTCFAFFPAGCVAVRTSAFQQPHDGEWVQMLRRWPRGCTSKRLQHSQTWTGWLRRDSYSPGRISAGIEPHSFTVKMSHWVCGQQIRTKRDSVLKCPQNELGPPSVAIDGEVGLIFGSAVWKGEVALRPEETNTHVTDCIAWVCVCVLNNCVYTVAHSCVTTSQH